jgi:hypothetical protein
MYPTRTKQNSVRLIFSFLFSTGTVANEKHLNKVLDKLPNGDGFSLYIMTLIQVMKDIKSESNTS